MKNPLKGIGKKKSPIIYRRYKIKEKCPVCDSYLTINERTPAGEAYCGKCWEKRKIKW